MNATSKNTQHSPEEIVEILHSIKRIALVPEGVDAYFDDNPNPSSASEFEKNSFTRKLLELIENHYYE